MTNHLRVSLGFSTDTDPQVADFAGVIITNMTGNAAFPNPPVTLANLKILLQKFRDAKTAQSDGGPSATAAKKAARGQLIDALRQLAQYVEQNCHDDLPTLLSSGFTPVTHNNRQHPLLKPVIVRIDNGSPGQLLPKVKPVPNAASYESRYAATDPTGTYGPFQAGGVGTDSRAIPINNLTPGTLYTIQIRAVGGSTGYSDWSDPATHWCM